MNTLVVGSSHGIGKATVQKLLSEGNAVIGIDIERSDISHSKFSYLKCDLSNQKSVASVSKTLADSNINQVVYCAAEQHLFPSKSPDLDKLYRMFTVNVVSAWQLIANVQSSLILKRKSLDSVVLVSSVHAIATSKNIAGYALTKASLASLTRSLAIDFSDQNTRVNGIIPGAVKTRLLTSHLDKDQIEKLQQNQLINHIAEPEEIAKFIIFLLKDGSSYATGQNFVVDGGVLALLATEAD